jgi:hypothetical protein
MLSDHLKTCDYCRNEYYSRVSKPTIKVKSAASYGKRKKLSELAAIIKGISYPNLDWSLNQVQTKSASAIKNIAARPRPGPIERQVKLKELWKLVRG